MFFYGLSNGSPYHDATLEGAFHDGLLLPPPTGVDEISGTVRALVKDANMNAFALIEAGGKAFAVPLSDADRDRLSIGNTATFRGWRKAHGIVR